jgi:hypothetical protein
LGGDIAVLLLLSSKKKYIYWVELAFRRDYNGKGAGPVYEEVNAKGEATKKAYGADYVLDVASLQWVGLRQLWVPR